MRTYCKSCCRTLPRERFSAAGLSSHLCKQCQKLPAAEQHRMQALDELGGFSRQKNLSAQNVRRLQVLVRSTDALVARQAQVLLEVARVHPHLSKRVPYLQERHPELHQAYLELFGTIE